MGVMLKSTIGLGTVYCLMFAPTGERPALGRVATLCGHAVVAQAQGGDDMAARIQAAGCLVAVSAAAAPLRLTQAEEAPAKPRPSLRSGGLTGADLATPWYGPGTLSRKSPHRG